MKGIDRGNVTLIRVASNNKRAILRGNARISDRDTLTGRGSILSQVRDNWLDQLAIQVTVHDRQE